MNLPHPDDRAGPMHLPLRLILACVLSSEFGQDGENNQYGTHVEHVMDALATHGFLTRCADGCYQRVGYNRYVSLARDGSEQVELRWECGARWLCHDRPEFDDNSLLFGHSYGREDPVGLPIKEEDAEQIEMTEAE